MSRTATGHGWWRPLLLAGAGLGSLALSSFAGLAAELRIETKPEALKVEARDSSVESVLQALRAQGLKYRAHVPLDRMLNGTYEGPLRRVLADILDRYDYVTKQSGREVEVVIFKENTAAQRVVSPLAGMTTKAEATAGQTAKVEGPAAKGEGPAAGVSNQQRVAATNPGARPAPVVAVPFLRTGAVMAPAWSASAQSRAAPTANAAGISSAAPMLTSVDSPAAPVLLQSVKR